MRNQDLHNERVSCDGQEKSPEHEDRSRAKRGPRKPKRINEKYLERSALYYLERYGASSEQLRNVMKRRIAKSAKYHESSIEEAHELLERLILKLQKAGYLDDKVYAASKARGRHRRGQSAKAIASFLREKGVEEDAIEIALAERSEGSANPELQAALTYCRKRRAGPYRDPAQREEYMQKDLAALSRQGFAYTTARKVVEEELDELEREIEQDSW